jgi:Fur family transcriptional regulator, ferric uptake regulator
VGSDQDYEQVLALQGIKHTKQRKAIIEILVSSLSPVSADYIYLKLKEIDASISLSTVYRNLELLNSKNLVIKSTLMNDDKASFELNHMEHKHHLICVKCSKIVAIDDCPLEELEKKLHSKTDFDITGHKLEVYGYCPNCKNSR